MPPVDNNPRANLDAFQRLTRSLDKADSSQVRLSDDGSIKARSAFVTKLVSLFTRASKVEANNRAVAEAFVGAVERNLQRQVGKSLSQDWAASIVDNVRAHLADQLAGKAMLSLGDLKAQLAYLKDDLAVGVFVQTAQSQTESLKSAMDQYRTSAEGKPSVEELSSKFANGGKLTADELQQVKDWHASAQAASTDLLALVDGDTATQLRSRLESKVTSQRAAGETDSADAWQETLDLVAQWQGYAGEFDSMVSEDINYAAHMLKYGGDPSLTKDALKGERWATPNPGHEPLAADAPAGKSALKKGSVAGPVDPKAQWLDKGGQQLPSNAAVPEDLASPHDPRALEPQSRIVNSIVRDKALPGEGHEATRVNWKDV